MYNPPPNSKIREAWLPRAACKDMDINLFFLAEDQTNIYPLEAVTTCKSCPVLEQCKDWAVRYEAFGYQGGLTPNQRHKERSRLRIALWSPQQNVTLVLSGRPKPKNPLAQRQVTQK